jgi:hypothetical protein
MMITAVDAMNDALEMCSDLGLEMVPGFSTHWPMGAETMIRLGYPDLVHEWVKRYRLVHRHYPRLEAGSAIDPREESSWRAARGDFNRVGDWQALFERELMERPWREVLVEWWPRLMPGVAGGLTHGLIRTTHAVRGISASVQAPTALHLRELASGLAYWAGKYVEQPGPANLFGPEALPGVLATIPRLHSEAKIGLREKGSFRHMSEIEGWTTAVSRLAVPHDIERSLSELTASFAQANLVHGDQFPIPLIHAVTAPAAVRLMLPYLPATMHLPSFIAVWQASAALLATFAPERRIQETEKIAPENAQPTLSGAALAQKAVEHGDEHVMKLTEACLREYAIVPDARYLVLAEGMLNKIPRFYRGGGH